MKILFNFFNSLEKKHSHIKIFIYVVFFIFSFSVVTTTIVEIFRYHHPIPFWESLWVSVPQATALFAGEFKFIDLFSFLIEHRMAVPRLFYFADYIFFQGKSIFLIFSIFVIQFISSSVLIVLYGRAINYTKPLLIPGLLVTAMMFSMLQEFNFCAGFQICFVGVYAAASATFLSYSVALERRLKKTSLILPIACMLVSMIIASLTMANGALVGLVLFFLSFLQRNPLRITLSIGSLFVGIVFCYTYDFTPLERSLPYSHFLTNFFDYIVFAITYLGNPFVVFGSFAMQAFGMFGVFTSLLGCWLVWIRKVRGAPQIALLGVSIFVMISAGITALGRFGVDLPFSSRYITPGFFFWSSQILFWMSITLEKYNEHLRKFSLFIVSFFICISISVAQIRSIYFCKYPYTPPFKINHILWDGRSDRKIHFDEAANALISNVHDPVSLFSISPGGPDYKVINIWSQFLKTYHLSIFADPMAHWVGKKLSDVLSINLKIGACQGSIDLINPITNSTTPNSISVRGWAWNNTANAPIKRILLVNQEGIIIGIGSGGLRIPNFPREDTGIASEFVGWHAFTKLAANEKFTIFGVINNGAEACQCAESAGFSWITEKAEIMNLEKIIDQYKIQQIYNSLRKQGNEASNEELVAFLLKEYGYEKWSRLSPDIRKKIIDKVTESRALH